MTDICHRIGQPYRIVFGGCVCLMASLALSRTAAGQVGVLMDVSPSESVAGASETGVGETRAAGESSQPTPLQTAEPVIPCHRCGQTRSVCACMPPVPPAHEVERGTSLFWYGPWLDPCNGDPCQGPHCVGFPTACPPTWYVVADLMPLMRDQNDDVALQSLGRGGEIVLDTDDCSNNFDAGGRYGLGYTLGPWYRLEGAFMGSYEWDERAAVRDNGINGRLQRGRLFSPFSDFGDPVGIAGVDFNRFASIDMQTEMNGVELNLRRRWNLRTQRYHYAATSFLVGIRYLNVDEQFRYYTESAVPAGTGSINDINIRTENDLLGAQLGWLSQFLVHSRGWLDFEIKGGIFNNRGSLNTLYIPSNSAGATDGPFEFADERDRSTFMGELSLSYSHQVCSVLSVRAGYNAMWLTGLALASQNMPTDINMLSLGPAQVKQCGDLVFHGPHLGLVFSW